MRAAAAARGALEGGPRRPEFFFVKVFGGRGTCRDLRHQLVSFSFSFSLALHSTNSPEKPSLARHRELFRACDRLSRGSCPETARWRRRGSRLGGEHWLGRHRHRRCRCWSFAQLLLLLLLLLRRCCRRRLGQPHGVGSSVPTSLKEKKEIYSGWKTILEKEKKRKRGKVHLGLQLIDSHL